MAEAKRSELPRAPRDSSGHWPVPWQPVEGRNDGIGARVTAGLALGTLELVGRLPEWLLALILGGVARTAKVLDRRRTGRARAFLRQALGEMSAADSAGLAFWGDRVWIFNDVRQ